MRVSTAGGAGTYVTQYFKYYDTAAKNIRVSPDGNAVDDLFGGTTGSANEWDTSSVSYPKNGSCFFYHSDATKAIQYNIGFSGIGQTCEFYIILEYLGT
jgi:hypothetical protein